MESQEEKDIAYLRSLEDNFDDEGGKAPTGETIDRATKYFPELRKLVLEQTKVKLGTPRYFQGPDGSVDLLWKKKGKHRLLANVPADNKEEPTYYGDFSDGTVLEKN